MLFVDIETDGLLEDLTRVHCIAAKSTNTGEVRVYHDDPSLTPRHGSIAEGVDMLSRARATSAHNYLGFDKPALRKLWPKFRLSGPATDTMVTARVAYPGDHMKQADFRSKSKPPKDLLGRQSLEAWGHRLRHFKDVSHKDEEQFFRKLTQELLDYCIQDTQVGASLLNHLAGQGLTAESLRIEHRFAEILHLQQHAGFAIDRDKAQSLERELEEAYRICDEKAQSLYPPRRLRYKNGKGYKEVPFNPNSRNQVAMRLIETRGWEPLEYTPGGDPKVGEEFLRPLPWPEAQVFADRFQLIDRLEKLSWGESSILKNIRSNGRVPAVAIHNGTVTHRCTHKYVSNVPKETAPWGQGFRDCFEAPEGRILVGWDADGLEQRMLGNRLAPFDGGSFIRTILEGDKAKGTDLHSRIQKLLGLKTRDTAKTFFYAWLYGSGPELLAAIAGKKTREEGQRLQQKMEQGIPGLRKLIDQTKEQGRSGYIHTLDGRRVPVRSLHSVLNTQLQADGAIVMKAAVVRQHEILRELGLSCFGWWDDPSGADVTQVCSMHDEVQMETHTAVQTGVEMSGPKAIRQAGEDLNVVCPLDGEAKTGRTWKQTH